MSAATSTRPPPPKHLASSDYQRLLAIEKYVTECVDLAADCVDLLALDEAADPNREKAARDLCAKFLENIKAAQDKIQEAVALNPTSRNFEATAEVYEVMYKADTAITKVQTLSSFLSGMQALLQTYPPTSAPPEPPPAATLDQGAVGQPAAGAGSSGRGEADVEMEEALEQGGAAGGGNTADVEAAGSEGPAGEQPQPLVAAGGGAAGVEGGGDGSGPEARPRGVGDGAGQVGVGRQAAAADGEGARGAPMEMAEGGAAGGVPQAGGEAGTVQPDADGGGAAAMDTT